MLLLIPCHFRGKALLLKVMEVTDPKACTLFLLSKLADKKVLPQECRFKMQLMKHGLKNSIAAALEISAGADDP